MLFFNFIEKTVVVEMPATPANESNDMELQEVTNNISSNNISNNVANNHNDPPTYNDIAGPSGIYPNISQQRILEAEKYGQKF